MEIKTSEINFTPIELKINIRITSLEELNELIRFDDNTQDVSDYSGNDCPTLTEIVNNICSTVTERMN